MSLYKGTNLIAGNPNSANPDLSNITNIATTKIAHGAMPSSSYIDLALGASGSTYTAPADGYISFTKQATGGQYFQFNNTTAGWFNNVNSSNNGQYISIICPVKKDDIFRITYDLGGSTAQFRFIYANGSAWEA